MSGAEEEERTETKALFFFFSDLSKLQKRIFHNLYVREKNN